MNALKSILVAIILAITTSFQAQTADEIINNYFENTGGKENWEKLKGIKMTGVMKMQNMEIPFEQIMMTDGRQSTTIELQGNKMIWAAYDGETSWSRNQMTMEAEKNDNEATEKMKNLIKDWPSPFLNYKEKGYSIELIGNETIDGADTFKIKVTKDPIMINGKSEPNISHYYFDTENYVPIVIEEAVQDGPMKGKTIKMSISDYQEVEGLYFPFSQSSELQSIDFKEFDIDPEVDQALFAFPEGK
ncbi:outer membrane lipoprotein-sorting protein [Aquimarina aquimarini]|uniref:outer membrane lipoprotein-sorting protein n=1 Tax=Aquimarina aquimarini TaxID=1191734 RepID=UPI000D550C66|nr:outer membrane lipoprotein-sorting protein [Aquimarina aquimarini]